MTNNQDSPFEDSALTTILVVSDMARSKAFYVDVLGADLRSTINEESI